MGNSVSPQSLIQGLDLLVVLCQQAYWASLLLSKNEKAGLDFWGFHLLDINTTDIFS